MAVIPAAAAAARQNKVINKIADHWMPGSKLLTSPRRLYKSCKAAAHTDSRHLEVEANQVPFETDHQDQAANMRKNHASKVNPVKRSRRGKPFKWHSVRDVNPQGKVTTRTVIVCCIMQVAAKARVRKSSVGMCYTPN